MKIILNKIKIKNEILGNLILQHFNTQSKTKEIIRLPRLLLNLILRNEKNI